MNLLANLISCQCGFAQSKRSPNCLGSSKIKKVFNRSKLRLPKLRTSKVCSINNLENFRIIKFRICKRFQAKQIFPNKKVRPFVKSFKPNQSLKPKICSTTAKKFFDFSESSPNTQNKGRCSGWSANCFHFDRASISIHEHRCAICIVLASLKALAQ